MRPLEANPPLIVNTDAVLAFAVAHQRFKTIARQFFTVPISETRDQVVELEHLWGRQGAAVLRERQAEAGTPEARFRIFESVRQKQGAACVYLKNLVCPRPNILTEKPSDPRVSPLFRYAPRNENFVLLCSGGSPRHLQMAA